ncbi:MAG: bis-aminopropyl spermidine synthase family protein [Pseudonocardiaceae bacterium]
MLVTPLSVLARHRLAQCAGLPGEIAQRVCQVRSGSTALFPELAVLARPLRGEPPCPCCGVPQPTGTILALAEEVRTLRPAVNTAIDQCHVDPPSLSRRLLAMCASRPMAQTRVAFVGDDDLASVALLRFAPPEHLLLLDIDERIIALLRNEASRLGLNDRVSIGRCDLSTRDDVAGIAARYGEMFDLVVTDPPYAEDGMAQFVEVAMTLAAYTGELHIAVPAVLAEAWTDELSHSVQSRLVAAGFLIDRVVPGAFTYETSDVVSSLVVARRLPGGPARRVAEPNSTTRFYTTRAVPEGAPLLSHRTETEREP